MSSVYVGGRYKQSAVVPPGSASAGSLTVGTWYSMSGASVSIDTTGRHVLFTIAGGSFEAETQKHPTLSFGGSFFEVRLLRNGVEIGTIPVTATANPTGGAGLVNVSIFYPASSLTVVDTGAGEGINTYTLQYKTGADYGSFSYSGLILSAKEL